MKHVHRWVVDPPTGSPQMRAVCECGAVRTFPSEPDVTKWGKMTAVKVKLR